MAQCFPWIEESVVLPPRYGRCVIKEKKYIFCFFTDLKYRMKHWYQFHELAVRPVEAFPCWWPWHLCNTLKKNMGNGMFKCVSKVSYKTSGIIKHTYLFFFSKIFELYYSEIWFALHSSKDCLCDYTAFVVTVG